MYSVGLNFVRVKKEFWVNFLIFLFWINTDIPYHIATNSGNNRGGDQKKEHRRNRKRNKGSLSSYPENGNNGRWKAIDGKHGGSYKKSHETRSQDDTKVK